MCIVQIVNKIKDNIFKKKTKKLEKKDVFGVELNFIQNEINKN